MNNRQGSPQSYSNRSQQEYQEQSQRSSSQSQSESLSFGGLSRGYQNWENSQSSSSRINQRTQKQSKSLTFFLVLLFSTFVSLQIYYIAYSYHLAAYYEVLVRSIILVVVILILVSAYRWVQANQGRREIRTIPIINKTAFEHQKQWLTKVEVLKLQKHPIFSKVEKMSKKGISTFETLAQDNQDFRLDLEDNEYEIFEGLKEE